MPRLRIATRESPLAMWQAKHVAALISRYGEPPIIVPMVSGGDTDMRPIDGTRTVGVFTKRIQEALLNNEGDVAVHSMKDLPTDPHPDLLLIASPDRETVSDCLLSPSGKTLDQLPKKARVGTGSRRRAAQLLRLRPDLQVQSIRGNVQTRLAKMQSGEYDAIVLAAAGLERLEMNDLPRAVLPLETMLPAPGQGALAIEVRRNDADASVLLSKIDDPQTSACTLAERTLLARLHGGCLAPIAALAVIESGSDEPTQRLWLRARVLSSDGTQCLEHDGRAEIELQSDRWQQTAVELGTQVSDVLIDAGAKTIIESGR